MPNQFVIIKHGTLKFALKEDVNAMTPMEIATREFSDLWVLGTHAGHQFTQDDAERAIELVNTRPHVYKLRTEAVNVALEDS